MTSSRIPIFDIARGASVLFILIAHLPDQNHHLVNPEENNIYLYIRSLGWIGVDIFFALSGFLISSIIYDELDRNGRVAIRRFYFKRFFRIAVPLYVLTCIVLFCPFLFPNISDPKWIQIVGEVFFLQNYVGNMHGITWSLGVEEHFYLIMPVLINRINHRSSKFPFIILALLISIQALRTIGWLSELPEYELYTMSHFRFDSILAGCLGAWISKYRSSLLTDSLYKCFLCVSASALYMWLVFERTHPAMIIIGYTLIPCTVSFWLVRLHKWHIESRNLAIVALIFLGRISYSLYLIHLPVQYIGLYTLSLAMKFDEIEFSLFYLVSSIVTSYLFYWIIERPSFAIRELTLRALTSN